MVQHVGQSLQKSVIQILRWYQRFLSPDTGLFRHRFPYGYCRYAPHCSEYAIQAILVYGLGKGGLLAVWRILRCNPFNAGGIDPVQSHSLTRSSHGMV